MHVRIAHIVVRIHLNLRDIYVCIQEKDRINVLFVTFDLLKAIGKFKKKKID